MTMIHTTKTWQAALYVTAALAVLLAIVYFVFITPLGVTPM